MASRAIRSNAKIVNAGVSPLAKWFASDTGKTWVRATGVFGSALASAVYIAMHAHAQDKYRDIVRFYRNGLETKVSKTLLDRANSVVDDYSFFGKYTGGFDFFHVNDYMPFTIGSLKLKFGAYVGLPMNFEYEKTDDVEVGQIAIDVNKPVPWGSDDGQLLKESLILSDRAQKFAIAQQIALSDTYYVHVRALSVPTAVLAYSALTIRANEITLGLQRRLAFRMTMYSVIGLTCYGLFVLCLDYYNKVLDKHMDDRAMSLGIEYAKGAVEYYTQVIKKNIALRGLLPKGEQMFTETGDEKTWIRSTHIPYSKRKERAEKVVQKYAKLDGKSDNEVKEVKSVETYKEEKGTPIIAVKM